MEYSSAQEQGSEPREAVSARGVGETIELDVSVLALLISNLKLSIVSLARTKIS
jgi:hypothetical protein